MSITAIIETILRLLENPYITGPIATFVIWMMKRDNNKGWSAQLVTNVLTQAQALKRLNPDLTLEALTNFALGHAENLCTLQKRKLSTAEAAAITAGVSIAFHIGERK